MSRRGILVLALLWQSLVCIHAQNSAPASRRSSESQAAGTHSAQTRKTSKPYTGDLSIFDSPGRAERLQINRVLDILDMAPGRVVADIGAGSGWFTMLAAKRVTETGNVYAVDINPESIRYINQRAQKEDLHNIKTVLSTPDDPLLPAEKIDSVLLLKTYHEVEKPVTLLRNLRHSLRTGAKVGIIDRNGNGENHGVARQVVIREASQAGYTLREQYDFVKGDDMDYFLVFTAK
ncbi:MAG: SAM-dependent methyltransferase [Acidobacteria bacterium]|nr:MAG: SAM-dependent methyltransferase [Acidobacteriota bacterium]